MHSRQRATVPTGAPASDCAMATSNDLESTFQIGELLLGDHHGVGDAGHFAKPRRQAFDVAETAVGKREKPRPYSTGTIHESRRRFAAPLPAAR